MSACDNKLRANLMEAMKLDEQKLEAEMQGVTPHVFSDVHEKKMEKLMQRQMRKRKWRSALRYAVAACLVLLLTGSILIISSKDLQASRLSIDIIEWLEEFFSADKGTGGKKKDEGILFDESQIGYLPERFEKVEEFESFNIVYYRYRNDNGENIQVNVVKDKSLLQIDNKESNYEVLINGAGYEYTFTYSEETQNYWVVWKDKDDLYYYIRTTLSSEEVIKIMNGISY